MRDAGSDRRWRVDEARYVCRGAIIERHRRPEANGLRMRAYRHDRHLSSSTERLAVRRQHDDRRVGGPAGERQLDRRHDRGACLVAPHEHRLLRRTPYDTTATWEDASTRVCLFTAMTITTQPPARCVSIHNHRGTTSRSDEQAHVLLSICTERGTCTTTPLRGVRGVFGERSGVPCSARSRATSPGVCGDDTPAPPATAPATAAAAKTGAACVGVPGISGRTLRTRVRLRVDSSTGVGAAYMLLFRRGRVRARADERATTTTTMDCLRVCCLSSPALCHSGCKVLGWWSGGAHSLASTTPPLAISNVASASGTAGES